MTNPDAPRHVDDFILDLDSDAYAAFMLNYFRLPAILHMRFAQFMEDRRLFCTHGGKRWRVTGASRMGDVWITTDFEQDVGYELRVAVDECSDWGATP